MPVSLIDPRTGDQVEVDDDSADRLRQSYGLVSPEDYQRQQQAEKEGVLGSVGRNYVAPVLAAGQGIEGLLPEAISGVSAEQHAQNVAATQPFFAQTQADAAAHPIAAFAGQALPLGVLGAASGGAGEALAGAAGASPLVGAGVGLGAESALTGVSQEAVDAVTDKRDFSVQAALMKGGMNLAIGSLFHGAGKLLGRGAGAEAAAAEGAVPGGRNYISELDPGEVPEASGPRRAAGGGKAMSGGAAAADFDRLQAGQAIDELNEGKGVNAGKIAEAAPRIREQLSVEAARDADFVNEVLHDDAGLATKHEDFVKGAAEWTPEMVDKQNAWLGDMTEESAKAIEAIQALPDARGVGTAAEEALQKGLRDVNLTEGAARNVRLDAFKRGVDNAVSRIGNAANSAIDAETRQAVMNQLSGVSDQLRSGLLDEGMFGANARVQAAHNEPLTEMIGALGRVQKKLYEVTGRTFGETGVGSVERRADPDAFRRLFEDPHLGGKLFQQDLAHVLDQAETLGRNRLEQGMSRLDRLPEFIEKLQSLRDDMNTAQVLHVAEAKAGVGGHGTAGASVPAQFASVVAGKSLEMAVPGFGNVIRRQGEPFFARQLDRAAKALGFGGSEMAERGTATRALLDRYAGRVKGSELLEDPAHRALMPEGLRNFLDAAHAPPPVVPGPGGGASRTGQGTPPGASAAPGSPANDVAGKVAAVAALGGGAALLAPGTASAAQLPPVGPDGQTLLPSQAAARQAMAQQMAGLTPDEQAAHIKTAEAFARIGQSVEQRTSAAVSDLFTVAKNPDAAPRYRSPAARELDQRAADLGVPRAVARFMGKNVDDPVQAWREKGDLLSKVVADPSRLAASMAANLGDLPRLQPAVFGSMVSQTMQTIEYLHDKLPAPSGKTTLMPNGYPPPVEDIQAFAGHWVGALHPLDSLDDLAANDLLPEQMEAVKERWAPAYEMFRSSALSHIYQLSQKRGPIPLEALQQIDSALELNGAGEPALSGEMASLIQQATAQAAQQAKPPAAPSPMQSKAPSRLASSSLGSLHDSQ